MGVVVQCGPMDYDAAANYAIVGKLINIFFLVLKLMNKIKFIEITLLNKPSGSKKQQNVLRMSKIGKVHNKILPAYINFLRHTVY